MFPHCDYLNCLAEVFTLSIYLFHLLEGQWEGERAGEWGGAGKMEKGTDRKSSHPLVYFPDPWQPGLGKAKGQKPRIPFSSPWWVAGNPRRGSLSVAFSHALVGSWISSRAQRFKTSICYAKQWLNSLCHKNFIYHAIVYYVQLGFKYKHSLWLTW